MECIYAIDDSYCCNVLLVASQGLNSYVDISISSPPFVVNENAILIALFSKYFNI